MFRAFKKTIAVCMFGLGIGILLVLLLPISWWLFLIGLVITTVGIIWLSCWNKGEWVVLKIVVKKVPKCLRGFVKLIFGIKD